MSRARPMSTARRSAVYLAQSKRLTDRQARRMFRKDTADYLRIVGVLPDHGGTGGPGPQAATGGNVMTARYRLPDILGGAEFEAAEDTGSLLVGFDIDGVSERLWFPRQDLTEVKPLLPPEPPDLTVLRAGHAVYQRDDNAPATQVTAGQWWMAGRLHSTDWASIAHLDFERLVPAPEPIALPWSAVCSFVPDDVIWINPPDSDGHICVYIKGSSRQLRLVHLTAEQARDGARALWAAADAAEATP